MIDTIVIRIHNLRDKEILLERLLKQHSGLTRRTVDLQQPEFKRYTMLKNVSLNAIATEYTSHRNKLYIKSSSYFVNYLIDADNDYIEFNFSIPKYKYGTNVVQFVQQFTHRDFMITRNSGFEWNVERTYKRLLFFIKTFFDRELGENLDLIKRDVEINRLDICFNQIFQSKREALAYLGHQKGIKQRYERIASKKMQFETSVYLPGKYFTCKIYHKGTEFHCAEGDRVKLERWNKILKCQRFNVEDIGNFADKILRYEVEFKGTGLNYLFKQYIFRKNDSTFKRLKKSYRRVDKAWKSIDCLDGYQQKRGKMIREHRDWKLWQNEAQLYEQMISQSSRFMLDINASSAKSNSRDIDSEYNERHTKVRIDKHALFSPELMELCFKKFRQFFWKNQLGPRVSISNLEYKVNDFNTRIRNLRRLGEKKGHEIRANALAKFLSFNALFSEKVMISNKMYSRTQIYDNKKTLKALGYAVIPATSFEYKHDNTFETYHNYMIRSNLCKR